MAGSGRVKQADLISLIEHMSKNAYKAKNSSESDERALSHCLYLFGRDYKYSVVNNTGGELCNHYPSKLILLEYETRDASSNHESIFDLKDMKELFSKARFARCRTRFVVPVIMIEGKVIYCIKWYRNVRKDRAEYGLQYGDSYVFDRIRGQDIKLLKKLNVSHICDLMLENKKVKYFMNVTSSEKVDKWNRYGEFRVWSLPYPGCEFFKVWKDNRRNGEGSMFDWSQDFVDTVLDIPNEPYLNLPDVDWEKYKTWNLVQLTRNYLKLILRHIQDGKDGILIHCISGWDRTPLFTSLLRLSLWADGLIHKSLSALEILYLTVSYDWYLFGHNLPDRLNKGEEIFVFCFHFLKFIQDDEFVVHFPQVGRNRHISRAESDVMSPHGILLDYDFPTFGSSLSLNSENSHTSQTDTPPLLFMVGAPDEDGVMISAASSNIEIRNSRRRTMNSMASQERLSNDARCSSPIVGSWQIVAAPDSYLGTSFNLAETTPHGSHRSSSSGEMSKNSFSLSELAEYEPSMRRKRLEEVRALFYNVYDNVIGFESRPDSPGALSLLLGTVTGKLAAFTKSG